MNKDLLSLYAAIRFPAEHAIGGVSDEEIAALTAEIGVYGYTLGPDIRKALKGLPSGTFSNLRDDLHAMLAEVSGSTANHAVLFNRFPYSTPEQHDYMERRVQGAMQNFFGFESEEAGNYQVLTCGHVIDPELFDLREFGACPICQEQVAELDSPERAVRFDFKSVTPLKVVRLASPEFIAGKVSSLLARNSSLSETERRFALAAASKYPPTRPAGVFRETLPLVYQIFPDADYIGSLMSGATDVLRIAAFLSDEAADLSLKEPTRFQIRTARDRKNLLRLLEARENLAEDLMRHRERWLRLAEVIHPENKVNRKRFPKTSAAFDQLRNTPQKIETFSRKIESTIMREKTFDMPMLKTLASRPAEYLRRLDFLLRTAETKDNAPGSTSTDNVQKTLSALGESVEKAPMKLLLEIRKYLYHRVDQTGEQRIFLPKGKVNRMQVVDDVRAPISDVVLANAIRVVEAEITARYSRLPKMGKVYIDPALKGIVLPFNRRGDSATTSAIIKGARYPVSRNAKVLRMFVHWKKNTDVDLSAVLLNDAFEFVDQVSFRNLKSGAITHSGDLQSAPKGGSEFVDVDIADALKRGYRYVVMSLISFRGVTFDKFPCFAGFMERDALTSGQRYEPEAVAVKFDLTAAVTNYLPIIFDLKERQVVFADLVAGSNHSFGYVAGKKGNNLAMLAKAVMDLPNRKPTVYDVLELSSKARGTLVDNAKDADVSFTATSYDLEEVMGLTSGFLEEIDD